VAGCIAAAACHQAVESSYAKATEEIEAHIPSRGRVLLSVDATNGDTMFFAPVKPDIAQRWRDKASSEQNVCRAGVRSPMDRLSVSHGLRRARHVGGQGPEPSTRNTLAQRGDPLRRMGQLVEAVSN
jgi:hypothetical protein